VDIATVQQTCSTGFLGVVSCAGIAEITGTIRTARGQTAIRGAAHVSEGTDSPVAIYIIALNPVELGSGGCSMDSYDYWTWPTHGDMSGDLVIFCYSAGVHGNPSSRTETLRLRRN
jgi:hypothetical protein